MANITAVNNDGIRTYEDYLQSLQQQKNNLGKNDFLKLLAAQLQYQNPLEPQSDTDFIAQMAQFTSLEQMSNMSETMALSQAYNFAGKTVYAEFMLDGELVKNTGIVESVFQQNGVTYLNVGEYTIPTTAVKAVFDSNLFDGVNSSLTGQLLNSANLIGKYVSAQYVDADGNKSIVTGQVVSISLDKNGSLAALVDGKEIPLNSITDVSSTEIPAKTNTNQEA